MSLGVQVHALVGERGLQPAGPWLDRVEQALGSERFVAVPTLCWLGCGDRALSVLTWGGAASAAALTAGVAQGPALLLCYAFYLSLLNVGQSFLAFQWDVLLLETGFASLLLVPWTLAPRRPGAEPEAPMAAILLLRLVLFKLMFSSGLTKLTWSDPTWWDLSALQFHYWTQPLPTPAAWVAHQLPGWLQRASCLVMYAVELGLPFLLFFGPRPRRIACFGFVGLQGLILLTGNYGFFNLLSIVLAVPLLDDGQWPRGLVRRLGLETDAPPGSPSPLRERVTLVAAGVLAALSIVPIVSAFGPAPRDDGPEHPLMRVQHLARRFGVSGEYGLFRVMTTTRPEIEIQGQAGDGSWHPYAFRYKPGDVARAPSWLVPHMPRLDWLMWFAALDAERLVPHGQQGGDYLLGRADPWLGSLCAALRRADPTALRLLASDPFAGRPPDRLRLVLWQYAFAPRGSDAWWQRERVGLLWQSP